MTPASREDVNVWRSKVIEQMIKIEWLMNALICQHYFSRIVRPFMFDVLYNEQFSFGLRRSLVERIVGEDWQDLRRLGSIRNLFAHCGLEVTELSDGVAGRTRTPDPRDPDKDVHFDKLFADFERIRGPVEERLFQVYKSLGGEAILESPGQDTGGVDERQS